jgi:molybdopterin-containing oxidoreductase family membrane subunit
MWLERLIIVVPTLANPTMPLPAGIYFPSLVEWALFIGGIAVFILGFVLFSKFFPLISIWEIEEGRKEGIKEVEERIHSYLPNT